MSQNLAQLCALLIEDTYGPLHSHIFSTLATHGRLSAREISQRCHLPLQEVKTGLAVLIECLFVFHHTASDGRTSYQANQAAALNLVRVGRFTQLMRTRFGPDGANVLKHLLIFGHDTGDNLEMLHPWMRDYDHSNVSEKDLLDESEAERGRSIRWLLETLVEQKFLIELRPAHFQTWTDTWRGTEMVVKASGSLSLTKGKKAQEELDLAVQVEMGRILNGGTALDGVTTNGKRAAAEDSNVPNVKRQKRSNGDQRNGVEFTHFDGRSMYRLDHDKLLLVLQHQMIANRVQERMGSRPGKVLEAVLHQCETPKLTGGDSQQPPTADRGGLDPRLAPISLEQLLHHLNDAQATSGGEYRGLGNGYANGSSHGDEIDMEELKEQVATLAEGSCDFIISQTAETGETTWSVDLDGLEDRSRNEEIMQMVKQRFGLMSLRIIRILMSRGKVDEKALQETGLLNAKDLRRCLAQLHAHGFIDLQEVPREPQRQPARTIYLWFYDADRVKMRMLENLFKSMCRLLQRLKVERQKVSSTLQKAERSDVKGKEHEMLRGDEIVVLRRWRRKELWYLSELERLGSSVDVCAWK